MDITAEQAARMHGRGVVEEAFADYDTIVSTFGRVEYQTSIGDYQGDHLYLLYGGGDRWGALTVGYGSCSGCDDAEGCESWDDVARLVNRLRSDVAWGTREETLAYVTSDARKRDYYTDDPGARRHWHVCKAILEPLLEGE